MYNLLVRLLIAALAFVISWVIAEFFTDTQRARLIGLIVGILTFVLGWFH